MHPKLMLLTGTTGEDGPHDWIDILDAIGLRNQAQDALPGSGVCGLREGGRRDYRVGSDAPFRDAMLILR